MSADRVASVECLPVAPRWIFIRLRTEQGLTGWGEAIVLKRVNAVRGAVADLSSGVVGSDPGRIEDLAIRMRTGAFFRGGPILQTASAGIEQALWDVKGKRHGLPVYEFLGGAVRERVRSYAWVGGDRPHDVVADVQARIEQGYSMVKMNATEEADYLDTRERIDAVVARIGSIRDAVGDRVEVALDFHGRVHRGLAATLIRELEPFHPAWIEEPLGPGLEDELVHVVPAGCSIPIATGERLTTLAEFVRLLRHGRVDVVQPDVSLTGLFELAKIAHLAQAHDVAIAPHGPNGPISLAASLQVDFAAINAVVQEQSLGLHYNRGYAGHPVAEMFDYLTDPAPLTPADGHLGLLSGPGLGLEIDEDAVAASPPWTPHDSDWRYPDGRVAEW